GWLKGNPIFWPRAEVMRLAASRPNPLVDNQPTSRQAPKGKPMTPVTTEAKRKTADGSKAAAGPLSAEELHRMDAYWRALNYLSVGQIYLLDTPLLKEALRREHIKPRLLGHWGTSPGLNMLCVHLNRIIKRDDLNMIYIIGPGHGGPSMVAHA